MLATRLSERIRAACFNQRAWKTVEENDTEDSKDESNNESVEVSKAVEENKNEESKE